ncbi:aminotransferase class IV [Neotabrizicola shimadae]|uniref:aminotransferase class IV n=1 Tax=Neotabrizicola shimadae TaxID=2807096 RepID=UPI0035C75E3F
MEGALREGGSAPELKLIETLLWDGARAVRADRHGTRMAAAATALGWGFDASRFAALARGEAGVPARLRLTLDGGGQMAVERGAVPAPLAVWRVGMAGARLSSGDPWLRVKSTRRAVYDAARAGLAPGLDEVVFLNERGEVCDGTITTLFFDRGQGLRTPPLSSGLLPGVLRAGMAVPEEVLMAEDLGRVRLWLGNSLRGLAPAVWVG